MKKLFLLSAVVFGLVFYSCSSDDDKNAEEVISLVGDWRLTNVDFTVFEEGGRPASDACIVELVAGYRFYSDFNFHFILGEINSPISFEGDYWTWEGDINDFKIIQTNPMSPPYNFGLTPTNVEAKRIDGKIIMTFHSEMGNGSAADFTLVKEDIDVTKLPVLTKPDGSVYVCGFFGG